MCVCLRARVCITRIEYTPYYSLLPEHLLYKLHKLHPLRGIVVPCIYPSKILLNPKMGR